MNESKRKEKERQGRANTTQALKDTETAVSDGARTPADKQREACGTSHLCG